MVVAEAKLHEKCATNNGFNKRIKSRSWAELSKVQDTEQTEG